MSRWIAPFALSLCLTGPAGAAPLEVTPAPTAFFGLHFIDTSTEGAVNGIRPDQTARTEMAAGFVAAGFAEQGLTLVDLAPVQAELDRVTNPADCNGCAARLARRLGATYALTGEVQKVSNLILSMNLVLSDAASGRVLRAAAVDIRGNTDESWQRGLSYLMRNRIFHDTTGGRK